MDIFFQLLIRSPQYSLRIEMISPWHLGTQQNSEVALTLCKETEKLDEVATSLRMQITVRGSIVGQ
jgi:hypothetical protein